MASIPDFSVRDLKLQEITKLAHENWELPDIKLPSLVPVAKAFRANIARVRFLMLLPTSIAGGMALTQRVNDIAEFEVTGSVVQDESSIASNVAVKITKRRSEILGAHNAATLARMGQSDWDEKAGEFHFAAAKSLDGLTETPIGAYGFLDILVAHTTGTWTAIETMLGDLWEAALNAHPDVLSSLKGNATRTNSSSKGAFDQSNAKLELKSIPLSLVEKHRFDLRSSMGSIFRQQRRFEFTRLSSIREAYASAFSEKFGRIDKALGNKALDELSAVRNVMVHRAGFADPEYMGKLRRLDIPKSELGKPVLLDGENVSKLIRNAIGTSKDLMIAVEDWITRY
ncbi:hypothetical protein NKJ90_16125 [Mesorhizobium sp. M0051]|uniref:hypothetical protein n=1 Tax=unclassified Mesorhizobium TaxID=325217 RepID=UPI0003CF982D|nr:hypothetical protein [Mesorhizobium sp. LNHC252B00]ESY75449.1 hypothetical protein X743_02900 [Mesorhizobium sp. LNHC252B00]